MRGHSSRAGLAIGSTHAGQWPGQGRQPSIASRAAVASQRQQQAEQQQGSSSPMEPSKPLTKMVVPSEAANRFSPGVPAQHAQQAQQGSVRAAQGGGRRENMHPGTTARPGAAKRREKRGMGSR